MNELKNYLNKTINFLLSILVFVLLILTFSTCLLISSSSILPITKSGIIAISEVILLFLFLFLSNNEISSIALKNATPSKDFYKKIQHYMVIVLAIFILFTAIINLL